VTVTDTRVRPDALSDLVAEIFRDVLRDDTLGADSDFFEAGGDSLAAFQITARIGEAVGAEVPVALVFAYPTPAELAAVVALDDAAVG
jgi:acyl carrier protein